MGVVAASGDQASGELVKKYASLLEATILWELEPVIQYDWKAPFRQARIPPTAGPRTGDP